MPEKKRCGASCEQRRASSVSFCPIAQRPGIKRRAPPLNFDQPAGQLPGTDHQPQQLSPETKMKKSTRLLITAAALTGLYTGALAVKSSAATAEPGAEQKGDKNVEKHGCKGQNTCKGKGGCKTSDAGCKGKNTCKGKGGCSTMDAPAKKA
jgi:hypothetical protein